MNERTDELLSQLLDEHYASPVPDHLRERIDREKESLARKWISPCSTYWIHKCSTTIGIVYVIAQQCGKPVCSID